MFAELVVVGISCNRNMCVSRRYQGQVVYESMLGSGTGQQIGAANNFRAIHSIIDSTGECVGHQFVSPPDNDIAHLLCQIQALQALHTIIEFDVFGQNDAQGAIINGFFNSA